MKTISQFILVILIGLLFTTYGCRDDEFELGALVTPTNLTVTYEIMGVDAENPYGDGSGKVSFKATADNAITYTFDFGDDRDIKIVANGEIIYPFATNGINIYNVTVNAVGTGGITTSSVSQVEVLSNFEDPDALEFLTGGDSKKWYWATDIPAFVGLGPEAEDYGNLDFTWPNWWQISPWDTDKECMYSAEFVFTKTGDNGLTFEQLEGPAFIPATYADIIGVAGDLCYGEEVAPNLYGVKTVTFSPSSSMAALEGGYRGTTMSFSDGGFMCWWVGTSEYDIIEVSDNILKVRIKQNETYAWYHIFTSVKPIQTK